MPSKADIWMPLYIGDYLADTSHLDAQRHGCYLLWMMHYWRKGPLGNNLEDLINIGKLRGLDATSIAQALLKEFFTLDEDGNWHQKRTDAEIIKWRDKSIKAKKKAKAAAEARWGKDATSIPIGNTQAMPTLCPLPSPLTSPVPVKVQELTLLSPNDDPPKKSVRLQDFPETWNSHCGTLPKVEVFTDSRKKQVATRIRQGITVARFEQAVFCCTEKPFLRGENERNWNATFDWLIKNDKNIEKAITESYGSNKNGVTGNGKIDRAVSTATQLIYDIENRRGADAGELLPGSGAD